jgi:NADH:ubiquinone oxidoreductase subunit E
VLVVGAGIGGMQASLDLANAGFKVYLVEKGPAIGGVMSQLDKTFPTNDCAMCTLAPRMVECGAHLNIEKLTYSEVEEISGQPGRFRIKVRKKARSVDMAKCTGCGTCMSGCPVTNKVQLPEPVPEETSEVSLEVDRIVESHGTDRQALIGVLQDANAKLNWLPEQALRRISSRLGIPYAEVYGTASFYKAFSLEPRGEHIVQVCMGTACHVRGAQRVLEELERRLEVGAGQTTKDRMFTLETVNCLGACALGPIVAVDGEFHGQMNPGKVPEMLDSVAEKKTA